MNHFLRATSLLAFCCGIATGLYAQNTSQNTLPRNPTGTSSLSKNEQKQAAGEQKIERIRTEDTGNRIDELRVGGETQTIDVQPKANLPAYQIKPDAAGSAGPAQRDAAPSAQGVRTWKILNF
jgi:hypothetical protein